MYSLDFPNLNRLKELPIWINRDKQTKVPLNPHDININAKINVESTWAEFSTCSANVSQNVGVGLVLPPDRTLVGLDFDDILNEEGEIIRQDVREFIDYLQSYTEVSPSGKGLHVIVMMDEKDVIPLETNKRHNADGTSFEIYNHKRYLTFTEDIYKQYDVKEIESLEMYGALRILEYPWNKKGFANKIDMAGTPSNNFTDEEVLNLCYKDTWFKFYYTTDKEPIIKKSPSEADFAILSHLLYFSADIEQAERLWRKSVLGRRPKVETRPDYRERTLQQVFNSMNSFYKPKNSLQEVLEDNRPILTEEEYDAIVREYMDASTQHVDKSTGKQRQKPKVNSYNLYQLFKHSNRYKNVFRFNEFSHQIEIVTGENAPWEIAIRTLLIDVQHQASKDFGFITKGTLDDAVQAVAYENKYHPIKEWLESLTWDGVPRLQSWVDATFGEPPENEDDLCKFRQEIGENTLKAMVARIYNPGCKYDYILVLEGPQGCGKSTFLSILSGKDYKVETTTNTQDKDLILQGMGKWVMELSEGETMYKSTIEGLKQFASNPVDTIRLPYARNISNIPRQFIVTMTTNNSQYLKDKTGNRRFLPIHVYYDFVDLNWFIRNRNQLFAEAVYKYKQDSSFQFTFELHKKEQDKREKLTDAEILTHQFLKEASHDTLYNGFFVQQIVDDNPQIKYGRRNEVIVKQEIGKYLKKCGLKTKNIRLKGVGSRRAYYLPEGKRLTLQDDLD